jgi:hypothetical protein
MGGMNSKRPTAIKGTINDAKTSVSTDIFAGARISVAQYLAPLRYVAPLTSIFWIAESATMPMLMRLESV